MNNINKTLYIPLYGKAYVSKKGIILNDKKAEEIWSAEGFDLKRKSKSKWLACYMGMRSAVFDQWLSEKMAKREEAVVLHLGCGLDSRVCRVGTKGHLWYDVDFLEVIAERKKYFAKSEEYHMIGTDVRDEHWLSELPSNKAIIVMEGMSMYLSQQELNGLLNKLCEHFEQINLLMDCYTELAAKASKYKNPINEVNVRNVYGINDPGMLENQEFRFLKKHEITPAKLIEELSGLEKVIFRKLYAGSFSEKLYRMYEFYK